MLTPIREKRDYYKANPEIVKNAIINGTLRAKKIAQQTMEEVRDAMSITEYENTL